MLAQKINFISSRQIKKKKKWLFLKTSIKKNDLRRWLVKQIKNEFKMNFWLVGFLYNCLNW